MSAKEVNTGMKPTLQSRMSADELCATASQIVDAFARRAQTVGIRSISMGDLAKELRVSTKTLYKYFRTKEDLVYELVVRWENRVHKPISAYSGDLFEILRYWVKVWVDNDAQFSTAFWLDLKSDYPQLYKIYVDSLYTRMSVMKTRVTPFLRDDLDHDFIWSSYFILMAASSTPKTFEKIGMTREQCVYSAFDFWFAGAVDSEKLARHQSSKTPTREAAATA